MGLSKRGRKARNIRRPLYRFCYKKDGKLGKIEVVRTSGFRDLDKVSVKALKDAGHLPEDWEKEDLEIKGHFIYILGNPLML